MPRPYAMLRGIMAQNDADLSTLGKVIGITEKSAVSHRMTNRTPWKLDEMYSILDFFKISLDKLNIYYMLAKVIATMVVMVFNFVTRKMFLE